MSCESTDDPIWLGITLAERKSAERYHPAKLRVMARSGRLRVATSRANTFQPLQGPQPDHVRAAKMSHSTKNNQYPFKQVFTLAICVKISHVCNAD
jgi:hypothetical protein